jgi:hypothetical protein
VQLAVRAGGFLIPAEMGAAGFEWLDDGERMAD